MAALGVPVLEPQGVAAHEALLLQLPNRLQNGLLPGVVEDQVLPKVLLNAKEKDDFHVHVYKLYKYIYSTIPYLSCLEALGQLLGACTSLLFKAF